jgi:CO/xanthine dehydrogenase FAD-binding subunit
VLAPTQGTPFSSPGAATLLRNHPPEPDQIEQAAHAALLDALSHLATPPPESAYRIDLAAHLTRQALDRSLARALRDPLVGRL